LVAVVALLATPLGPLGAYWRPSAEIPIDTATNLQLILFIFLNVIEALAFGFGIAFLIFGFPSVRAIQPASLGLSRAAHISISWLLINWWAHDSLHIHIGMKLDG